jgi:muconolactone D-isomerase
VIFMVRIDVTMPADMPPKEKDDVRQRENDNSIELMKRKKLRRIWRIVGQVANFSVWEADSLEELHTLLVTLPMYPYMKIEVTPLIQHPLIEAWTKAQGALPAF